MTVYRRQNMFMTNFDKWGKFTVSERHGIGAGLARGLRSPHCLEQSAPERDRDHQISLADRGEVITQSPAAGRRPVRVETERLKRVNQMLRKRAGQVEPNHQNPIRFSYPPGHTHDLSGVDLGRETLEIFDLLMQ